MAAVSTVIVNEYGVVASVVFDDVSLVIANVTVDSTQATRAVTWTYTDPSGAKRGSGAVQPGDPPTTFNLPQNGANAIHMAQVTTASGGTRFVLAGTLEIDQA